jgi:hypothetical protein
MLHIVLCATARRVYVCCGSVRFAAMARMLLVVLIKTRHCVHGLIMMMSRECLDVHDVIRSNASEL